jgi:hypothetical protein
MSIAKATLQVENDTLVTGDSVEAIRRNPRAQRLSRRGRGQAQAQANFDRRVNRAQRRRSSMSRAGHVYTSHQTELNVTSFQFQENTATLTATETSVLPLSINNKPAEDAYSYTQEHRFTFSKESSGWVLSSDERLNSNEEAAAMSPVSNPLPPLPESSDPPSLPPASFTGNQLVASEPFNDSKANLLGESHYFVNSSTIPRNEIFLDQETLISQSVTSVNKQEIVNYAHAYSGAYDSHCRCNRSYNSSYRSYDGQGGGGDCTNFVSQALRAAGWRDIFNSSLDTLVGRADTNLWWYNSIIQSYTWVGAPNFYNFLRSSNGSRRATREPDLSKLEPGDIIQIDFAGDSLGIVHSVIVTHKIPVSVRTVTGSNLLRIAYHSTNTLDRSFDDFYGDYPGAVYYGWKIKSSY